MIKTPYPSVQSVLPLIEMFNICPVIETDFDSRTILKDAMIKGYIIDPSAANIYARNFISSIDMKYNSTFYETWNDVSYKSRFELLVDQLIHYMSTYGTDFEGNDYIPNRGLGEPEWNTYKVIKACSFAELYQRCFKMLSSGVALKSSTVSVLTDYIIEYCNAFAITPNVDAIKNREALIILCDKLGIMPVDPVKLFSFIVYKATGQTMIIKNRELRTRIRNSVDTRYGNNAVDLWLSLNEAQLMRLAQIYNRFKPLFVAFKSDKTKRVINRIGHLSKKHHKPMKRGFWETVLSMSPSLDSLRKVREEAKTVTNFKLLQVMQSIRERYLLAAQEGDKMYIIRNGKIFIKDNDYTAIDSRYGFWEGVYDICKAQLIQNLSKKACTVKFPNQYSLTCPTSEKNFIGNFPMGTSVEMGENSVIGIYWRNEWGTRDFDLSFNDVTGIRIGWNSDYYDEAQSVIYSGDMTNAEDGANEVLHFRGTEQHPIPNGIVYVNRYNGKPGSKYRMFFGTDKVENITKFSGDQFGMSDYMVDPNNLQLEAEITQNDASQQMVGVIINGKFYFYELSCGYSAVANAIRHKLGEGKYRFNAESLTQSAIDTVAIMKRKANVFIPLKDILLEAGFKEAKKNASPDLDLTDINRDTLIELFSNE